MVDRVPLESLRSITAKIQVYCGLYSHAGKVFVDGPNLTLIDSFGERVFHPITSVGIAFITLDPAQRPAILLVSEEPGRWDLPAGKIEPVDVSLEKTIIRELKEETGIELDTDINMMPLTYAVSSSGKAGLQYMMLGNLPHQFTSPSITMDADGRYFSHSTGVENNLIALEPLDITINHRDKSLLQQSHHPWAYRQTFAALERKVRFAIEAGLTAD